jgi:gliding motility-associated-like protein
LQYIWTDSLGNIVGGGPILVVSPDSLTMYIISIYDSCINHYTVDTIYVPPLIVVTLSQLNDTIVCPPTVLTLNITSNVPNLDYTWSAVTPTGIDVGFFDDNTLMNPKYTVPTGVTEIIVTVVVTTEGACAKPMVFTIRTIPKGIASKKPALICGNGTVQLQAFGGEKYSWRPAAGLNDSTIANPIASEERTYTVAITDSVNCTREYSIQVLIDTLPIANAGRDRIICARSSIQLFASGSDYNTYEWSPRGTLNKWNIPNPIASPDVTTTYYVKAINNLCTSYDSVTIYVVEIPETDFDYSFDSCARIVAFSNKTIGSDSLVWDFGDGDTSLVDNPVHQYDSVGTFTVTLIANKNTDCSDTSRVQITIPEIDINKRRIPNVFTPNNDGKNDTFKITGGNVECFIESISIYNRWGKLMYEVKNQTTWEWDGRINNEVVPPGIYFYSVKGKGFDDVGSFSVIY